MSVRSLNLQLKAARDGFELNVSLTLPGDGITAIYGPSGCGKTTLLKSIAGLVKSEGHCSINGQVWQDQQTHLVAHDRAVGYVFQDARLFPHLSVTENISYGYQRTAQGNRKVSIDETISWMGLEALANRRVHHLSGGERQRVAMARALACSPQILLMDEPLSALDDNSKARILPYLERLPSTLNVPVLYVTHAMTEVARLADYLVLMEQGHAVADGPLTEILSRANLSANQSEESGVVIKATITERDERFHLLKAVFPGGHLWLKDQGETLNQAVRLRLLARDISLSRTHQTDQSILNSLEAKVDAIVDGGHPAIKLVRVLINQTPMLARLTTRSVAQLSLNPDDKIWVQIKSVAVID